MITTEFLDLVSADDLRGLESEPVSDADYRLVTGIVERYTGVTAAEIDSYSRQATICRARHLAYTLLRARGYSYCAIARWLGVNHASIRYGVRRIGAWVERSDEACTLLDKMIKELEDHDAQ